MTLHRRALLAGIAATALGGAAAGKAFAAEKPEPGARRRRIRQSVASWCFMNAGEKWDLERLCRTTRELGGLSVELVPPEQWNVLRKHDLVCAMAPNGMPGAPFMRGFNNPRFHEEVIGRTRKAIDACAEARFPNVIAFTGYKWLDPENPRSGEISRSDGADHCVKGLRAVAEHAERRGVTVCLEHLNTRDDSHPMKGHPGYQGDDLDWVIGILRRVGSPRVKLLFDVYHVQIMHGDILRRLDQCREFLGHVHVAGNPGRGELDENQEIQYPAVMRKLLDLKFAGYVGQEFIPTRDPLAGLRQALRLCDV